MKISLIVAMAENRVIGLRGKVPWRIPEDLKYFKEKTMGKSIIMGRKTYESIGTPLPGRFNIVVSRHGDCENDGLVVTNSIHSALDEAEKKDCEAIIIGGAEIYEATLPLAERIYLTEVHENVEGDTTFPPFDRSLWKEVERKDFEKTNQRPAFSFVVLERK